ncbi:hypothetical protein WDZ92_46210, partial [Nostoc sp. NIES-2111]
GGGVLTEPRAATKRGWDGKGRPIQGTSPLPPLRPPPRRPPPTGFRAQLRRSWPSGQWHFDEVTVSIGGKRQWLGRAVDSEAEFLTCLCS